ncbi:MAG: hypothetical protein LIP10_06405 [Clostridiales bacterium]|nr:hypothetical protein [Clostridiales bacterium]
MLINHDKTRKYPGYTVKNMAEGKPLRLILFFALPLMLRNAFQQFYTLVDTMVV